jgi:hypothetical protein
VTHLDYPILLLENGTSERTLSSIIKAVGIRPVLDQERDKVGVAVVCGQHKLVVEMDSELSIMFLGGFMWTRARTSVSPFSLVILGGRPAGKACSKTSI